MTFSSRGGSLTKDDIADLLRAGLVQFVVVAVGIPPRWIQIQDRYQFWKDEVKPHLAKPDSRVVLDEFPDGYCYFASEWDAKSGKVPIIVLETYH